MDIGIINSLLGRPFVLGHQIRPAIETLAHSLTGALGLNPVTIIWNRETQTASMDVGGRLRIVNPADDARINRALFIKYVGFVVHELLHRKYTNFSFLVHAAKNSGVSNPKYLHALHNGLEDGWIERKGINEGFVGNIETVLHQLLKLVISESGQADWSDPANYPFILAVKARNFPGITVPCPVELEPIFAEAIRRLQGSTGTNDNIVIAQWVYHQIQQLQPEPQNPPQDSDDDKSSSDSEEDSEENAGEDSGESGSDSEGDSEGDDSEGASEGGSGGGSGSGEEEGDGGSDGDEDGSQKGSEGPQSDDQGAGEGEGTPRPAVGPARPFDANTQPREVEPTVELGNGQAGPGTFNSTRHVFEDGFHVEPSEGRILAPAKAQLRNALRRAFENTDQTDWDKGRKFGAFDIRAAQRWATGSINVFQRRREQGGIKSAVLILVDCSSSMNVALDGVRPTKSKMLLAKECAAAIYESLSAAGVETGVMTFCDGVSAAVKIGTPWPKAKSSIQRLKTAGSTNDWQAVSACHHILFNRPEERRVLLVLTDGEGNRNDVRRQCQIGEALGITTIGVGIGISADCYPNNVRVDSAAQLAETAIGKLIQAA